MRLQIKYDNGIVQEFDVMKHENFLRMRHLERREYDSKQEKIEIKKNPLSPEELIEMKTLQGEYKTSVTDQSPIYNSLKDNRLLGPDNKTWFDVETKLI